MLLLLMNGRAIFNPYFKLSGSNPKVGLNFYQLSQCQDLKCSFTFCSSTKIDPYSLLTFIFNKSSLFAFIVYLHGIIVSICPCLKGALKSYRCLFIIKYVLQAFNCSESVNLGKQLYCSDYIRKSICQRYISTLL